MSLIQVNTYSESLSRVVTFHVLLPNDVIPLMKEGNRHHERPMKNLFLLHGFSGNANDWMLGTSVQELSMKYNLAVIMPSGENSFYLNGRGTGRAYAAFTGEEIVEYCHKTFALSDKKEDNFIGGLSMGGFGAIRTGLKYPERFSKIFGLSSALIINNIKNMKPGEANDVADYDYYAGVFGNLDQLEESENNPEFLIKSRIKQNDKIQPIFMACGTEDFLLRENREFKEFLVSKGVDVVYYESEGVHDWKFWNHYLEPAIQWLLNE